MGCITREDCTDMAERYAESTLCFFDACSVWVNRIGSIDMLVYTQTQTHLAHLHRVRDQAIGHVADARAAVALDGGAQQAQLPHFGHDLPVELLLAVGHQDAVGVV